MLLGAAPVRSIYFAVRRPAGGVVMGAGPCCGFCYMCAGDDAHKDGLMDDFDNEQSKRQSKWCVDDSATERVFIPDGGWYTELRRVRGWVSW